MNFIHGFCSKFWIHISHCPAEPGFTLPFQTVVIQINWLLIWICTVSHLVSKFISTIWIKKSDWLRIISGCGILINLAWQGLVSGICGLGLLIMKFLNFWQSYGSFQCLRSSFCPLSPLLHGILEETSQLCREPKVTYYDQGQLLWLLLG